MARQPKSDLTINQYGTALREYMKGYTQRAVAEEMGWHEKEVSALLRGVAFPSKAKVRDLLEWLSIPKKERKSITASINEQRLFPVVTDKYIGHRIRALRVSRRMQIKEIADDVLTANVWNQVEGGLVSLGTDRRIQFSNSLGTSVKIDEATRNRLDRILENNSDVDLLTIGYYLINQYESRNEKE